MVDATTAGGEDLGDTGRRRDPKLRKLYFLKGFSILRPEGEEFVEFFGILSACICVVRSRNEPRNTMSTNETLETRNAGSIK